MRTAKWARVTTLGLVAWLGAVTALLPTPAKAWDSKVWYSPARSSHSLFTRYAIDQLRKDYPDVQSYKKQLVDGSNVEVHELKIHCKAYGVDFNAKRRDVYQGTNPGCKHPELIWKDSLDAYRGGNKKLAYFYLGVLLHQIEDMGVPSHANNVYHQGPSAKEPLQFDNFECLALVTRWKPSFEDINKTEPENLQPWEYYEFSRKWAHEDAPNYDKKARDSFSKLHPTKQEAKFLADRRGRTCTVTKWALKSALGAFEALRKESDQEKNN